MDLHGLKILNDQITAKGGEKLDKNLGLKHTAMNLFHGHTVFSIFNEVTNDDNIEKILELFHEQNSKNPNMR